MLFIFFFSSRRRHTRWTGDWSSDVCSSDLAHPMQRVVQPNDEIRRGHLCVIGGIARIRLAGDERRDAQRRKLRTEIVEELPRSEERRVGKECRVWWSPCA